MVTLMTRARAQENSDRKTREEALAWFSKINSGNATSAEHQEHRDWLAKRIQNRQEYEKLDAVWSDLANITDFRQEQEFHSARTPNSKIVQIGTFAVSRRVFLVGGAVAASAAGVAIINGVPDFLISDYATGIGERRDIILADGSGATLDADTAIDVRYSDNERRLVLLRGRAFFDVASDPRRPFIVEAADGTATALGTRFTVHQWDDTVTVSVEESAVAVSLPNSDDTALQAGQYVSYDRNGLHQVGEVDGVTDAAWRHGKLMFEDKPLRQVISEINRYRSGVIYITDKRLVDLRVTGIFDTANPDVVIDAIQGSLPVRAVKITRYLVLLRSAD
ncbi:MAG: iron dicitrate transport regulator FecR [Hyphomicrobiales bacterium]|nr:MAG: iron dicitrate transport regulator FecR [Hyphomicrobiales bacterium]